MHQPKLTDRSSLRRFLIAAVTVVGLATVAVAQQAAVTLPIFRGQIGDAGNVRIGPWGSGRADVNNEARLVGQSAIRVTTQNFFAGARLDFPRPVNLSPAFGRDSTYIRFQLRFPGGQTPAGSGFAGGGGGGDLGLEGGGRGGASFGGGPGFGTGQGVVAPFKRMRFVFTMADGSTYEATRDLDIPPTDEADDYIPLSIPLAALLKKNGDDLPIPTGQGALLSRIAVFGDRAGQFFIGEITVITDQTDIVVQPLQDQIAFVNNTLTFVGEAEGGATSLKYLWDFDASDGIQDDAEGRVVFKTFPRAGKYKVTLTVVDVDGFKRPSTTSIELDVAE